MEKFEINCTAPQVEEEGAKEEVMKYNSERTYDIGDIRKTMKMILPKEYLERTDLSNAEKRVLAVILHTCRSDAYKKLGGYYPISNANLKANAKIGSTGLTPITNHLKELGLIDFEQGEGRTKGKQRKATRYTILFDDKLIQKERFITDSIKPSDNPTIKPSDNPTIKPSEDSIKPSDNPTIKPRTSTSVDNQEVTPIEDGKSGAVYVKGDLNGEVEGNLKLKRNLKVEGNVKGNLEGNVDVNVDGNGEVNLDGNVEGNLEVKGGVSTNNNNIGNTNNKMEELIKKLITSIDNNTRVKSEVDTKILDKLDKISTSIDSLPSKSNGEIQPSINSKVIEEKDKIIEELQDEINKLKAEVNTKDEIIEELQGKLQSSSMDNNGNSNGVVQSTIDTNDKVDNTPIESSTVKSETNSNVIEESDSSKDVKESSSKSCGEVKDSSSSNFDDRIMSYQLGLASSNPIKDRAWKREQQKKLNTKTASKSDVGIVQESNSSERSYTLNKLRKEIVEPFKWMISNINDYGKLDKAEKDFYNAVNKLYSNHSNVITKSEIEPLIDEVITVIQHKEEELTQNADTNETPSKSNVGIVQDSQKEVDKRFHTEDKTAPKAENGEEKKESTAEPSTSDGKTTEVPNADTLHSKEEQENLDEEVDEAASSIFLDGSSKNTPTKKCEEVEFPKTTVIPLREEEQRQVQELLSNQTVNALLEDYSPFDNGKYIEIQTEIRKAVADGKYKERLVQAYLNELEGKGYYCNVEDAMKPLEDTKEDTAETPSDDVMKIFPKTDKRFKEDEDQVEVIEESDDEVTDDDMKGVVVGGSYPEENDAIF